MKSNKSVKLMLESVVAVKCETTTAWVKWWDGDGGVCWATPSANFMWPLQGIVVSLDSNGNIQAVSKG